MRKRLVLRLRRETRGSPKEKTSENRRYLIKEFIGVHRNRKDRGTVLEELSNYMKVQRGINVV